LEQLFPEHRAVQAKELYADLGFADLAPGDRPYVVANMIASADGRATLEGKTRALSSETDRELFLALRTQVDAVMVGTATIGIENYGPMLRSEERRQRRAAAGLEPVPLAVTASRSLELPVATPLFQDPDSRIVVLTNSDREAPPAAADVTVERIPGAELDLVAGLGLLRTKYGVRSVLLEGGPTLLGAVATGRALDELFLTLAPAIVGSGGEIALLEGGPTSEATGLELRSIAREDGFLFLRYATAFG
jgi:riboflavin biosynthesis pyrimidine reductase